MIKEDHKKSLGIYDEHQNIEKKIRKCKKKG